MQRSRKKFAPMSSQVKDKLLQPDPHEAPSLMTSFGSELIACWNMGSMKEPGPGFSGRSCAQLAWMNARDFTISLINNSDIQQTSVVNLVPTSSVSRVRGDESLQNNPTC
jgi:hypothetical protein